MRISKRQAWIWRFTASSFAWFEVFLKTRSMPIDGGERHHEQPHDGRERAEGQQERVEERPQQRR